MNKQFTINLTIENTKEEIENFNKVKNNIVILYVIRNININDILNLRFNYVLFENYTHGNQIHEIYVNHPYKSEIIDIEYIEDGNEFMQLAKKNKQDVVNKLEKKGFGKVHVTSVVYGKNGKLISTGTNSDFHLDNGCVRKELKCKSGEGYELCEGCQPINHGEQIAIKHAIEQGKYSELKGANAYMYGHYWACEGCTKAMEKAGIKKLYLSKPFTKEFLNIQDI